MKQGPEKILTLLTLAGPCDNYCNYKNICLPSVIMACKNLKATVFSNIKYLTKSIALISSMVKTNIVFSIKKINKALKEKKNYQLQQHTLFTVVS